MVPAIQIEVRNVYGLNKAYPVDANAEHFAAIAGTKTLTELTLMQVILLGFDIEVFGGHRTTLRGNVERVFSLRLDGR